MKKVAVLFHDGFEEVEALSVVDIMRRANVECTMDPGFEEQLIGSNYQETLVQRDENIITGKGPAAALAFGYTLLEALGCDSSVIKEGMQYTYLEKNI